jgi:transposase-like protein
MSVLSAPHFHDEAAAFERVEKVIWPDGPVCFHCGCTGRISSIKPNPEKRVRYGLKKCGDCKKQFTVRIGTIFEESKLPLHIWLQAMHLMCASKKGVSSHQLHRVLEITYKSAWFLSHRIREAMRDGELAPFGSDGGDVEVDETYIGREPGEPRGNRGPSNKMKVLSLVERNTGRARSIVMDFLTSKTVGEIVAANMATEARLITDATPYYIRIGPQADKAALGGGLRLFCGSDRGGQRAAVMYSLIVTAKMNDIDPQAWLADTLARIAAHPAQLIDELLPWNWRPPSPSKDIAA